MQSGTGKEGGTVSIQGVGDEERIAPEKVTSRKVDRGDVQEAEDEEELERRKTIRKHDPRQPSEQRRIDHAMAHVLFRKWCKHLLEIVEE